MGLGDKRKLQNETWWEVMYATCSVLRTQKIKRQGGMAMLNECWMKDFFFLWRYSPNSGLGLPPRNFPFHFSLRDRRQPVGLLGRVISSSQGLYLYTNTEKRAPIHKHQTSMPLVGFEPTTPASERANTMHVLDRSADERLAEFIVLVITRRFAHAKFIKEVWGLTNGDKDNQLFHGKPVKG
jgi:hypothetical protein